MRIDYELNADVDPGTTVVVTSDFAFEPETVFHRAVAARTTRSSRRRSRKWQKRTANRKRRSRTLWPKAAAEKLRVRQNARRPRLLHQRISCDQDLFAVGTRRLCPTPARRRLHCSVIPRSSELPKRFGRAPGSPENFYLSRAQVGSATTLTPLVAD